MRSTKNCSFAFSIPAVRTFAAGVALAAIASACAGSAGTGGGTSSPTVPSASAAPVCTIRPYVPGTSVTGAFTGSDKNDCAGPPGSPGDQYSLALTGETDLDFTLSATGFPPFLHVYTATNRVVFQGAGGSTQRVMAFLSAGEYRIVVGRTDNVNGSYTLTAATAPNSGCPPNGVFMTTVPGAVIRGVLEASDCGIGGKGDSYLISLGAGETLTVTTTMDQAGQFEFFQDAPGHPQLAAGSIQKNTPKVVTFNVPTTGGYQFIAESVGLASLPINYMLAFDVK